MYDFIETTEASVRNRSGTVIKLSEGTFTKVSSIGTSVYKRHFGDPIDI